MKWLTAMLHEQQAACEKLDGMFPLFRCARMLMAGGADTPSSWR
jgi:hypothetical protein